MTLAYDICRCNGVKSNDELIAPCNTCRRVLEQEPSGPITPWFTQPPEKNGQCEYVVHMH